MITSTEFLKQKGLIQEGSDLFVITLSDGREIILNALILDYASLAVDEMRKTFEDNLVQFKPNIETR